MKGYIYSLHGKTEKDIFYIGATVNPTERIKYHRTNFPRYLYGCHPKLSIIEEVDFTDKEELNSLERYWIHQFWCWGFNLVNRQLCFGKDIRHIAAMLDI